MSLPAFLSLGARVEADQSSRGGSIPRGTRVGWIFVTRVVVGHSRRSLALVVGLILSLVRQCLTSDFVMAFPVAGINRLSEYMEVGCQVLGFRLNRELRGGTSRKDWNQLRWVPLM